MDIVGHGKWQVGIYFYLFALVDTSYKMILVPGKGIRNEFFYVLKLVIQFYCEEVTCVK